MVRYSPTKNSSKRRACSDCRRSVRTEEELIPALFPPYFVGTSICKKAQQWADDEEKNILHYSTIVVRQHKNNSPQHIIDTIPWLKHSSWLDVETTFKKTLYHISYECTESEPSSEEHGTAPTRIEIKKITIHRENFYEYPSYSKEKKSEYHSCENSCDKASHCFIFPEPLCMYWS